MLFHDSYTQRKTLDNLSCFLAKNNIDEKYHKKSIEAILFDLEELLAASPENITQASDNIHPVGIQISC